MPSPLGDGMDSTEEHFNLKRYLLRYLRKARETGKTVPSEPLSPRAETAHATESSPNSTAAATSSAGDPLPSDPDQPALPPDKEAILLNAMTRYALECDDWRQREFEITDATREWVDSELRKRLYWFKNRYTPWLNSVLPLQGIKILEIGAGTGCATIPLLEAGANVTAIDLTDGIQLCQLRAELHGVDQRASFRKLNAADIGSAFAGSSFDMIAYFASLEHMTYEERSSSLRAAWSLLAPGQFLTICDTPNRLWYYDDHTARQNFFHWLPDKVAIAYAARTPRKGFNVDFSHDRDHDGGVNRLWRWGRGISYHDLEIALEVDASTLEVHGEWQYRREKVDPQWWAETWMNSKDGQYHKFLRLIEPRLPVAFLESELALMIRRS
jgi:2-polyprenyl-3-methyl-5-hydroxy-6-metoxy-1,4-benzoquinol methylase